MSLELPSRPNRPTWFDMINELHSRCSQGAVLHMGEITDPCELPFLLEIITFLLENNFLLIRKIEACVQSGNEHLPH